MSNERPAARHGATAIIAAVCLAVLAFLTPATASAEDPTATSQLLKKDVLVGADMWTWKPQMLAGGLGFNAILGVPGLDGNPTVDEARQAVLDVNGAWLDDLTCSVEPALGDYSSAASPTGIGFAYGWPVDYGDGMPLEFSWPVLPSSIDPADFLVTKSNGEQVVPEGAALNPNFEYNERSTVVLVGDFGNDLPAGDPDQVFPTRIEVVAGDDTPLTLVGKTRRGKRKMVSAVGMYSAPTKSPYDEYSKPSERPGPRLTAAKLTRMSTKGEGAPKVFAGNMPNDGRALYGKRAKFRLRMLTTGGFSPDGIRGVRPNEFERYFRLVARAPGGRKVVVKKQGRTYRIGRGWLRVVGLAELGKKQSSYDQCYQEDHDNQIDVILNGTASAVKRIRLLRLPGTGRYSPMYNPGGPGTTPQPGVRYTAPSPPINQPVTIDLRNRMNVTYKAKR
ncbi:MAG: hypothetical protein J0H66_03985 [Solirubrobacterales bacterium]|nr:hypothetical protein [Solirubrobacterales bacterium]OJU96248.1 MAG: hypothetical protein BGO23_01655 [Solirubrobacterales bacterium 67-14]